MQAAGHGQSCRAMVRGRRRRARAARRAAALAAVGSLTAAQLERQNPDLSCQILALCSRVRGGRVEGRVPHQWQCSQEVVQFLLGPCQVLQVVTPAASPQVQLPKPGPA